MVLGPRECTAVGPCPGSRDVCLVAVKEVWCHMVSGCPVVTSELTSLKTAPASDEAEWCGSLIEPASSLTAESYH